MPYETLTRSLRDCTLTLTDGTNSITVNTDDGDLTWTETIEVKEIIQRGDLSSGNNSRALAGNHQPQDISVTLRFTEFEGASGSEAPYYALKGDAGWTTTAADAAEVFMTRLVFVSNTPKSSPALGETNYETITFGKFFATSFVFTEGDDFSTLAITGRNFEEKPAIVRTAA